MNGIVVDASMALSWCFPDEQTPASLRIRDQFKAGEQAIVPAFWSVEVLNSLLVAEKKNRINAGTDQSVFRWPSDPRPHH